MKLLFLTDTHIRGNAPINRKDEFLITLEKKVMEVLDIIITKKVDVCLHGGDMFDRPDISPSIVREVGAILRQFPVPIYSVAGNHDIYGYNPATLPRTMLGLLDGLGVVNLLSPGEKVFLEENDLKVQLSGQHFDYSLDQGGGQGYIIEKSPEVDYALHIVHGLLLEKPLFPGIAYTLLENILSTEADLTLVGHYHRGFGRVIQVDGKYFVNPGSLVRLEASNSEVARRPQVVLIDLKKDKIDIELLKLKSALPGEEVLDETKLMSKEYREKKMADFLQGIKEVGDFKTFNIQEIMEMIAEKEGLKSRVREEAISRIGKAEEALFAGQDKIGRE